MKISRRKLIQGSIGLGALGGAALLKPNDVGTGHNQYFEKLSQALKQAQFSKPTLIIDKQNLNTNIRTLKQHIGQRYHYRIVVKSLPSIPLLEHISQATGSNRFMVFDENFLKKIINHFPHADTLLGKPLPAIGAKKVLESLTPESGSTIRWLVDSNPRLNNYLQLAEQRKQVLRINLEIDVGLHRGGFASDQALTDALTTIKNSPLLKFDGFMGYEPHVVKVPGNASSHLAKSLAIYHHNIDIAKNILGSDFPRQPIFNTAGSPSYQLHTQLSSAESQCNELSAGSCLLKPLDFDLPSLADHQAASFIATPILKALDQTDIPGVSGLGDLMAWWNPNLKRSLFT
jgi:D-serine deaminase-like pyridoxal phosphate-dependent protein